MFCRVPSNNSTDLFLYGAPYSKWHVHEEKNQHLCIRLYHRQFDLTHGDGLPIPEPPNNFSLYSHDKDSVSSYSEQQPSAARDADYSPSTDSSSHKITEGEFSDLIRDFLILNFRRILYVVCFLLGTSPASEF